MGCSDFLFVRPSFIRGMARTFDIFGTGTVYNISPTGAEADRRAILCDWYATFSDLRAAYESAVRESGRRTEVVHPGVIEESRSDRATAR